MKVALTVWDGRMSPVFDVSREAVVLTIENGAVSARAVEHIETLTAALKIERLIDLGITTVICGAISAPLHHALTARGLTVIGFVAGEIDKVVASFLAGRLPTRALAMPGCCGKRNRFRGGRHRGDGCRRGQL